MKRILLTQRVEQIAATGERRDALSQEWAALAESCGFLPLPMPNRLSTVQALLAELPPDGVLLTGGNSLMPYWTILGRPWSGFQAMSGWSTPSPTGTR